MPHMGLRYLLTVALVAAYALYMVHKYGVRDGLSATYLTWSFFVLGTPVADAGGILDIPIRILTGWPMVAVETAVISITISTMVLVLHYRPEAFERTALLRAFRTMLTTPWPYWCLVALCIVGTILSVRLGDLVVDNIGASIARSSWAALFDIPTEFWVLCAIYAGVLYAYVAGMLPLLRPILHTQNVYRVMFE